MQLKKKEIKEAIYKIFKITIRNIRIMIVKGKIKKYKGRIGYRHNWKKAYITLNKGQNLNLSDITE